MITLLEEGHRLTTDYHPNVAYRLFPCGLLALSGLFLLAALPAPEPPPIREQDFYMCQLRFNDPGDGQAPPFVPPPPPKELTTFEKVQEFLWHDPHPASDVVSITSRAGAYSTLGASLLKPPPRTSGLEWFYLSGTLGAFLSMVVFARSSMSVRGELDRVAGMLRVTERWLFLSVRHDFPLLELDQFQADEGTLYALSSGGDRIWLGATSQDEARVITQRLCLVARSG